MPDLTSSLAENPSDLPSTSSNNLLKRYRGRVDAAKRWRDKEGYEKVWKRLRDIYRLKMFERLSSEDRIAVAVAFATVNVIRPSIAVNYPKITVAARAEQHSDQATIAEAVVNYWWRHYRIKNAVQLAATDYLVYGHGWLKCGWRYEEGEPQPLEASEQQAQVDHANEMLDQTAEQNPQQAGDLPSTQDVAAAAPTTTPTVVEDRPFVDRVSPFDIFIDPEATTLDDAAWLAQRVVRDLEDVKADKRYKKGALQKLKADGSLKWQMEDCAETVRNDMGRVTLWEFYDLRRKTVCVFTDQGTTFLRDPEPMPYDYGLPFVLLRNYDVPDQFYPIGDLEAIEPLQNELNATRSAMVRARKLDIPKYAVRKNSLDSKARDALESDEPNTIVEIDDDTPSLQDAIVPVPRNDANAQLYQQHSQTIEDDIDLVTGVSEYQRGATPEIRRTATEASIIQDAANARAADKLDTIENFMAEVASRLVQLAQKYMTGEQTVRVTGGNDQTVWANFTSEDIEGEFDFEVEAGSTQPNNETFRQQKAIQLMNTLAPMVGSVVDPAKLAAHVMREGFGIKNAEAFLMQAPPQQGPQDKLIESINYKDTPPDIQRQIEAQAGLQPSTIGGVSPVEQTALNAQTTPDQNGQPNASNSSSAPQQQGSGAIPEAQLNQLQGQVGLQLPNEGA